jgi:alpha-L-arabinofuranosidase
LVLHRIDDGIGNEVDGPHPFDGVRTGTDVEVRVRIDGARIRCWVDGELIHDHQDDQRPWPDIVAGATSTAGGAECIVMLVNVAESVRVVEVEIDGWDGDLRASLMTLTADHPDVGEAFAPAPANPVSSTAKGLDRLLITLPALSVAAARVARCAADAETQES